MSVAFIDRNPTAPEVERLRLILSTYQDGTGQLTHVRFPGITLPGWRDFERSIALAFGGQAMESKYIFDVLLSDPAKPHIKYGLSCKMRGELDRISRDGRVTIELSNSAGKFWSRLKTKGLDETNYQNHPLEVGVALIEEVEDWHIRAGIASGGVADLSKSSYLVLSWNLKGWYQLHQFPLLLPDPRTLTWHCPLNRSLSETSKRIVGRDEQGILFEWYALSGGQLKYYPLASTAIWRSELFQLEPLPATIEHGVLRKVAEYFPDQWEQTYRTGPNNKSEG